jgi:hypothetical protein
LEARAATLSTSWAAKASSSLPRAATAAAATGFFAAAATASEEYFGMPIASGMTGDLREFLRHSFATRALCAGIVGHENHPVGEC